MNDDIEDLVQEIALLQADEVEHWKAQVRLLEALEVADGVIRHYRGYMLRMTRLKIAQAEEHTELALAQ